ncbi:MAG: alpha-L-glutamate ligase [Rhodospirillaceae bacterium]|nr:alpha-L-glutamate ligase [Rhodospirillaceae bacterium]
MPKIHVLHENGAWLGPLRDAFADMALPYEEWFLDRGTVDLTAAPPEGVFYNRMSASSHTRNHRYAAELTAVVLAWLAAHGRRVVNSARALDLEVSKARQYALLQAHGIRTPATVAAVGREQVLAAARAHFAGRPFLVKPNRGGTGFGVKLFDSIDALADELDSDSHAAPIDGVYLVQQYIQAPEPFITRAEFIGGAFHYAVRVNTSGGFDLCPADACALPDAAPKFTVVDRIPDDLRRRYEGFLAAAGIEVAGIEFVTDADGVAHTYDVNTNTNYNGEAEQRAGIAGTDRAGMRALARFLGEELKGVLAVKAAA